MEFDFNNKTTLGKIKLVMLKGEQGKTGPTVRVAKTAGEMSDTNQVYVYVGTTTDDLTKGKWYYWDGFSWAEGGTYNSQGVDTDTSLSVADQAADAAVTGHAIRGWETALAAPTWEVNNINASGAEVSNGYRIRTTEYAPIGALSHIRVDTGYECALHLYSEVPADPETPGAAYVGNYNGTDTPQTGSVSFITGEMWLGSDLDAYRGCWYRLAMKNTAGTSIDTSEGVHVHLYAATDTTLTVPGKAADAAETGDTLRKYNAGVIRTYKDTTIKEEQKVMSGSTDTNVRYTVENGVYHIYLKSGATAAAATALINLEGWSNIVPFWAENGTYYAKITETGTYPNAEYALAYYITGEDPGVYLRTKESQFFDIRNSSDVNGIISRFIVAIGDKVDAYISVNILSSIPNEDINPFNPSPTKVRVMQYNIGDYVFGFVPDAYTNAANETATVWQLPPRMYADKLENYKRFFGNIKPDIVALQEYNANFAIRTPAATAITAVTGVTVRENAFRGETEIKVQTTGANLDNLQTVGVIAFEIGAIFGYTVGSVAVDAQDATKGSIWLAGDEKLISDVLMGTPVYSYAEAVTSTLPEPSMDAAGRVTIGVTGASMGANDLAGKDISFNQAADTVMTDINHTMTAYRVASNTTNTITLTMEPLTVSAFKKDNVGIVTASAYASGTTAISVTKSGGSAAGLTADELAGALITFSAKPTRSYKVTSNTATAITLSEALDAEVAADAQIYIATVKTFVAGRPVYLTSYPTDTDPVNHLPPTTNNAGTYLFDSLFRVRTTSKTSPATHVILSNCNKLVTTSARTVKGLNRKSSAQSISWRTGVLRFEDKDIFVLTGYLQSSNETGTNAIREAQILDAIKYADEQATANGYKYIIICADINSGRSRSRLHTSNASATITFEDDTTSTLGAYYDKYNEGVEGARYDAEAIIGLAKIYGYQACNSDKYWGLQGSYVKHDDQTKPSPTQPLDAIFVKGNIKVTDFKVLWDDYVELSSDHIPVIADLDIF